MICLVFGGEWAAALGVLSVCATAKMQCRYQRLVVGFSFQEGSYLLVLCWWCFHGASSRRCVPAIDQGCKCSSREARRKVVRPAKGFLFFFRVCDKQGVRWKGHFPSLYTLHMRNASCDTGTISNFCFRGGGGEGGKCDA